MEYTPEMREAERAREAAKGPPDRVCIRETSPFYDERFPKIGVRFREADRVDVVEYCVSGRWLKVFAKNKRGERKFGHRGKPVTVTLRGDITVYWRA